MGRFADAEPELQPELRLLDSPEQFRSFVLRKLRGGGVVEPGGGELVQLPRR
jgi:hypothetical protein